MKILDVLRKVLQRDRQAHRPDHARAVEEQQHVEQARTWERKGGPVDPGFSA